MRYSLIIILVFALVACASPNERRLEDFEAIKTGMIKADVLEVAGPPHWSDRWQDHDRWMYYMVPDDRQTERVVYFKNGKVVLTGERIKPLLSAEEMDELKKPRSSQKNKDFKPSMSEDELRKAIKKEIEKQNKGKKKPKFETL